MNDEETSHLIARMIANELIMKSLAKKVFELSGHKTALAWQQELMSSIPDELFAKEGTIHNEGTFKQAIVEHLQGMSDLVIEELTGRKRNEENIH